MPRLTCSVNECNYNASGLCGLNIIDVSGGGNEENTCCASFSDHEGATNSKMNDAIEKTDIKCKANDCVHNDDCKCNADMVDICSCGSACTCRDTECRSYRSEH